MLGVDDLVLISVDDHLIEPPDVFTDHLPAKYRDRAPKLVRRDDGADVWTFGSAVIENCALNAVAGLRPEELLVRGQVQQHGAPALAELLTGQHGTCITLAEEHHSHFAG
jgi:hypothetical protein